MSEWPALRCEHPGTPLPKGHSVHAMQLQRRIASGRAIRRPADAEAAPLWQTTSRRITLNACVLHEATFGRFALFVEVWCATACIGVGSSDLVVKVLLVAYAFDSHRSLNCRLWLTRSSGRQCYQRHPSYQSGWILRCVTGHEFIADYGSAFKFVTADHSDIDRTNGAAHAVHLMDPDASIAAGHDSDNDNDMTVPASPHASATVRKLRNPIFPPWLEGKGWVIVAETAAGCAIWLYVCCLSSEHDSAKEFFD
ncbi:hypothetical protein NM688_g8913 [Phlebia brevispora]|uniref:Uncharacterized protein n=1 Tax=Phlebia brevispora TaxID=194682 RepID=A0ACC1RMY9_9APHY|nr:hypothetical protein NM688_g8913 [Phlebia brevispora]